MDISLRFEGDVAVITWNDGENRFNPDSLARVNEIFNELDAIDGPLAIVLTGTGKFFSNGLDLERFANDPDELVETAGMLVPLFGRILNYPAYSVAAINGHAFAGGAMLACTTDYRVMREDRGYWCLNEVELGLPLSEAMAALVLGRLPRQSALEAMLTARRFDGPNALAAGVVDEIASESEVLSRAIERATLAATKNRHVVAIHKRQAWGAIAEQLLGEFDSTRAT